MKRTTTEILIEVEETVQKRKTKQQSAVADEETINPVMVEPIVCPFCGGAFSTAENSENQNE